MHKQSLAYLAARRLKQICAGQFSSEVREKASLCLLDFLGAAQSGLSDQLSLSILTYSDLHAGKPEAYVFGRDEAVCAETAAFVNTVLAHA
jgi:2-methylcitrate dehydratase PrpD